MEQPSDQIQSELDSFREEWRAEVSARSRAQAALPQQQPPNKATSSWTSRPPRRTDGPPESQKNNAPRTAGRPVDDDEEYVQAQSFGEPESRLPRGSAGAAEAPVAADFKEPETALDFYEHAVEKETTGKLGDSLHLYRKAFRMDSHVDQVYRNKYFPVRPKPAHLNPPNAPVTVPNTAHHSLHDPKLSIADLIASFAGLAVQGAPPEVEGMPPPPCPIAELPDEILVHILRDVAILDVGDLVRLAQVCKRLAYLVNTEDQIWRRVCLGPEYGFAGMHYQWQAGVSWEPLGADRLLEEEELTAEELAGRHQEERRATTFAVLSTLYSSSWQTMFRHRPRVRFNGCYISTVNYIRAGQASAHQITWNSPVHIVTYYRYLRLFRDGTAISLCTTAEPADVVHHLTKDLFRLRQGGGASHVLPAAVAGHVLKGRWRLSGPLDKPQASLAEVEGDLFVETEGAGPKHIYRMELSLKSAGKAARNNKLMWKEYWNYNKLSDDWAKFGLKHDKPFLFSRVKSYGMGD